MHKLFIAIHFFVSRNKWLSVGIAAAFLLLFGFFASRISFEEDITRLIPKSERTDETTKVLTQLNFADKITVIINAKKGAAPEDLAQTATALLDSLQSCNEYIKAIQGKVGDENIQETFDLVYNNLPLFLEDKDYEQIAQKLGNDSIANTVSANYRSILSPSGIVTKEYILQDPFGMSFIALKKLQQLGMGDEFTLQDGFIITKDKQQLLLFISPKLPSSETAKNTLFVEKLNSIKDNINSKFGKTELEYFGSTIIAVANATQIKSDIRITGLIAIGTLMLIFMVYYRKFVIPLIILLPSVFGVVFAVALLYFLKGTISAISLGIGSILLGVTIDYSLHILTHYKHNSDVRILYKDITKPLIMSSSTTAIAFVCLLFVRSEALQDLGLFAAISVMVTAIFSLLIIPHLYKPNNSEPHEKTVIDKLAGLSFHNNRPMLIFSVFVVIASCFFFNKVVFNNDLAQLNFMPPDQKKAEKSLEKATSLTSKSIYLASYGASVEEVLQNNSDLAKELTKDRSDNKLLTYSSIGGIVLSQKEQQQKIDKWNSFWAAERKKQVEASLISAGNEFGFKPTAYQPFYDLLDKQFKPISLQDYLNVKTLMLEEFISEKEGFYTISTLVKVDKKQRDPLVKELSAKSNLLVIDRQQMNETFLGDLKTDFTSLVNYSFIAVIFILFVFFRRAELVLISCIPIVVTGMVTAGIMGMFNIQLNIFSTIVCTLVFGHGVDFTIFMTSALQKEYTFGRNEMETYRVSILLAVLTTVLGIGALVFAGHPALISISSVSLIGVMAALVITFVCYPVVFRYFLTNRVQKGRSPFQLRTFVHSTLSFIYYGLGGFLLSIFSLAFVTIIPAKKQWKMKVFRYLMSKFMKSVLYTNPWVKKKVLNPHGETFDKPAVIIANHTSFLDILAVGMISPKIIYLVSDWVYNSPVFGIGVKLAGFYPVSQGLEGGVEHLRKKVEEGYSLVVFPEGTRSVDNVIKRFHKGAFYLAEELDLDIVPVLIHGNSEVLPKGDFIIKDGPLTLKIMERITPDDKRFGNGYAERTKQLSRFFKDRFAEMRNDIEGPYYFRKMVQESFIYKEIEVIDAVKASLKQHMEVWYRMNKYIANKATILHIADDHGETDVVLALQQAQRKIYSYIENDDKRDVAKTSYIVKKREIVYLETPSEMEDRTYDVLIISGYIKPPDTVPENVKKIILLNKGNTKEYPGFEKEHEEADLVILRKHDGE
jgi:uncharacterized protein